MQKTFSFKKKIITTAIASVAAGLSSVSFAQEDAEEIVVTGIRASLNAAVDIKRTSSGVVDAISAEDIGKMPDANLAESLQRITGISIDRTDGEGAKITSRGFGPQFNLVTINGRQLSSASIGEGWGVDSSRSFDMSNIASESVSGVEVYKTGKASVPTGGIGATVNLKTAKPFDHDGFKASIGGKALMDQSTDIHEKITPELSGFVSWSDETFGASLSMTHQERNSGRSGFSGPGWGDILRPYNGGDIWSGGYGPNAVNINEPAKGELATRTQEAHFFHTDSSRVRDNALLTLQYKPTDNITATLDYMNVVTKAQSQEGIYSLWFSDGNWKTRGVQWDDSSISKSPIYLWQAPDSGVRDIALKNGLRSNKNKLEDVGFNLAYEASDALSFDVDIHHSKSSATPWDKPGSNITLGIGVNTLAAQGLDMSGDLPLVVGVIRNGGSNTIEKKDVGSTVTQLVNARVWSDVKEAKIAGTYKFDESSSINFGVDSLQTEMIQKQSDIGNQMMKGGWSVAAPGDINPEWYDLIDYKKYFKGYRTNLSSASKEFFAKSGYLGNQAVVPLTGVRVKYFDVVAKDMFANAPGKPAYAANPVDSTDRRLVEDINALFVETNLDGELGGMKVDVNAGLRYEYTDVESYARVAPRKITWTADRDYNNEAIGGSADVPYAKNTFHYNNLLPNLDLAFHVTDSLIARASTSKTISRASYGDLQMGASGNAPKGGPLLINGTIGDNSDGNVKLKPIESNNLDFSVEYYFNDTDYVSVGYFDKRVPNFIGKQEGKVTYAASKDPSNGPRAQAALAELKRLNMPLTEQNLFQMVASMNDTAHGCVNTNVATYGALCGKPFNTVDYNTWRNAVDIVPLAEDPAIVNNVMRPVNSKDAHLSGWEFAAQHFFGETGFGLQANYTIVNGSIGYNLRAAAGTGQFALTGLSDTANIVGIYEKDQIQARIAYNWRENFLDNENIGGGEPQFTKDYGQVDFSFGYKFTEDLTVSLEGTNILGADKKTYGRTENQVKYVDVLEARYALSARYNF